MPEVHDVIVNPFPHGALHLAARYQLGKQLRAAHYDQAIVLPNSLKSALVPLFARIPLRTGFVGEARYGLLNDARRLDKTVLPLMVERFAQLAETPDGKIPRPLADPKLTVTAAQRDATLNKLGLRLDQPVAVFCPGAEYGPAKRWPAAYFAETAQRLHKLAVAVFCPGAEYGPAKRWPAAYFAETAQRLHKLGYAVWLIGSNKDRDVAETIVALSNQSSGNQSSGNQTCRNLCGSTDLADAIALLSVAQLVISNDSGLMHLAAALDRPMLALFGSSSPQFTPPLSAQAQVVKLDIECSPCFKRECPLGHFNCMNQLTPDLVWKKIRRVTPQH